MVRIGERVLMNGEIEERGHLAMSSGRYRWHRVGDAQRTCRTQREGYCQSFETSEAMFAALHGGEGTPIDGVVRCGLLHQTPSRSQGGTRLLSCAATFRQDICDAL